MTDYTDTDEPTSSAAEHPENEQKAGQAPLYSVTPLSGMYQNWFLDYASYVILERAVPELLDGLKPVQRRLLHAMDELEDGRFNKVANIIGHTMKYHPHGDASIGDALVQLGQKELLVETQGNWGNIYTGDSAAAARYIEARLSKFALDVVFNPKITKWRSSYDGRNKEPVILPVKYPLLLAMGVEGIAVGLASKLLPHNFRELIIASIAVLENKEFDLLPDFPTGGMADVSKYNDGLRGGKVRIRAKISKLDKKTLAITEIPFATTTGSLIESIIAANDKGKIKIRKIDDNTAEKVEILIHLQPGVSPDTTIDALYAFTGCEVSVSPNSCLISNGKPQFLDVKEILRISTQNTVDLLRQELEIRKMELLESLHFASLEKIFIEKRIYRKIEECQSWEEVLTAIENGLKPYTKLFLRQVTTDDIIKLTEIRIKRISRYNSFKADDEIKNLNAELEKVQKHLNNLIRYAIDYFTQLLSKHGKGRERRTEIRCFDTIEAAAVAAATQKLFVNREEGFAGTGLKKDEFVCECSELDDIIAFRDNGTFMVTKVSEKVFIGKHVIHIDVFKRNDERTTYNIVYRDGKNGPSYTKRFAVIGITRDKEYSVVNGSGGSKLLYFSANPNGEAEVIRIQLRPKPRLKKLLFDFDFSTLAIKGRNSKGNILSRNPIHKVVKAEEGVSTLKARSIWFDDTIRRLNSDTRGKYLGEFEGDNKIITIMQSGSIQITGFDLSLHFDEDLIHIEKFYEGMILSIVYFNPGKETFFAKRFKIDSSNRKNYFLPEGCRLAAFSLSQSPRLLISYDAKRNKKVPDNETLDLGGFVEVMGIKAIGRRLSKLIIEQLQFLDAQPDEIETSENTQTDDDQHELTGDLVQSEFPVHLGIEEMRRGAPLQTAFNQADESDMAVPNMSPEPILPETNTTQDAETLNKTPAKSLKIKLIDDGKQMTLEF